MQGRLANIWKSLLRVQFVGIHDDFFELGGHSLLVVRLLAQIEKEFGVRLPLTAIFQAPTIDKLARQIRRSMGPIDPDEKRPLFCAGYGFALAQNLGWDQPFYELWMDSETLAQHSQIETIAASYVDEIRKIQPTGPYFLTGHSSSGIVAYEMAQQLFSQGEDVDLLAILETRPFTLGWPRRLMHRIKRFPWRRRSHGLELIRRLKSVLRDRIAEVEGPPLPPWELIDQLQARYKAKPYSGRITLFVSDEEMDFTKWLRKGWARKAAELEVIVVPGNHLTMVNEPHVRVLAAELKERLQRHQFH